MEIVKHLMKCKILWPAIVKRLQNPHPVAIVKLLMKCDHSDKLLASCSARLVIVSNFDNFPSLNSIRGVEEMHCSCDNYFGQIGNEVLWQQEPMGRVNQ